MITEHQIGFFKEISRGCLQEYLSERLTEEALELIVKSIKSNMNMFDVLGQMDRYEDAKAALKR